MIERQTNSILKIKKMATFKNLKKGNVLSETQFYVVKEINKDEAILLNDTNEEITVSRDYVDKLLNSANDFAKEEKITKTLAAELLLNNPNIALTVNFNKQVKPEDVEKEILDAYANNTPSALPAAVKKAVKSAINGVERTMVGRHNGGVNEFGRINFVDMEEKGPNKTRQVDPRTINWLIVKGIKYVVK